MTIEETEADNAGVRAWNTALMACIRELKGQLDNDSHTHDKLLAGAGPVHHLLRACYLRLGSGSMPGTYLDHRGTMLDLVETTDAVETHQPAAYAYCRSLLERHSSRSATSAAPLSSWGKQGTAPVPALQAPFTSESVTPQ
jgi:hypothetical protein